MKTYTEAECIQAIERKWGEIESYTWNGDHEYPECRSVDVVFTPAAAAKIAARCNASPVARLAGRVPTASELARKSFRADEIARELGHAAHDCPAGDCPEIAEFVEGGIAVFADRAEKATWAAQV